MATNTYSVYLDAAGLATVCREVFNAIGGVDPFLGGADWPPKLGVGRNSGDGLGRLDCVGWNIGGGGGQRQAWNCGGERKGDQIAGG